MTETRGTYQKKERRVHKQAFEIWYACDRDYNLTKQQLEEGGKKTVHRDTLYKWARKFDWNTKADVRDEEAERMAFEKAVQEKSDMLERHANMGRLLQRQAAEFLMKNGGQTVIDTPTSAIAATRLGVEIEREAVGLPRWIGELLSADEDELRRLQARAIEAVVSSREADEAERDDPESYPTVILGNLPEPADSDK